MTTRKDGNGANAFSSNAKSMGGLMNQGSRQSGAFLFNKAGIKQTRDRSNEHSDDITRDNVTSQITGNLQGGYALESSKNFNNTQQVFFSNAKDMNQPAGQELEIFSDQTKELMSNVEIG